MSTVRTYARNLIANWIGYGANLLVVFFLSPFVVHTLGDTAYGVWSLMVSLTGYLGLVEIGVRVSTGRHINYYLGRGDFEKVSGIVSTSLAFYATVGVLVLTSAVLLGTFFGNIFADVPSSLASQAKWVLLLLGINIWLGFFSTTFAQLLHARERFDLRNIADIVVVTARAIGIVWVLRAGGGLLSLAAVQVASSLLGCLLLYGLARWRGPDVRLRWQGVSLAIFRETFGFGVWAFVGSAGVRVIYYSNVAVIGLLLGAVEITYYTIGSTLIEYGRSVAGFLPLQTLKPATEGAAGRNALADLRWLLLKGSRLVMFFSVPLLIGLIMLGQPFIVLWMGPGYARSAHVLIILTVGVCSSLNSEMCGSVLLGIGKVRFLGLIRVVEAAANIIMSVLAVTATSLGIDGVAIGTLVPMILIEGLVIPWSACRAVGLPFRGYLQSVPLRWLLASLALAVPGWIVVACWPTATWGSLAAKAVMLTLLYVPIGWYLVLSVHDRPSWGLGRLAMRGRKKHVAPTSNGQT